MKTVEVGNHIATFRKLKKITQEELADFVGVSKAAVSKWESGQSYPDITLLPLLASYFNCSVDDLLSYEAVMSDEEIKKLYQRICKAFTTRPAEEVMQECRDYSKRFYSCYALLYHIALVMLNHMNLVADQAKVLEEVSGLLSHIEKECQDVRLKKRAVFLAAITNLTRNQPDQVLESLQPYTDPLVCPELIQAKAYLLKNQPDLAKDKVQSALYQVVSVLCSLGADYVQAYADEPEKALKALDMIHQASDIFSVPSLNISIYLSNYMTAALCFAMKGWKEETYQMLENYVSCLEQHHPIVFELKKNDFFDRLDAFFETLDLGVKPPRSQELIEQSLYDEGMVHPAFDFIRKEERFQTIVQRLKERRDLHE